MPQPGLFFFQIVKGVDTELLEGRTANLKFYPPYIFR
jgi:hypothetical protein